MFQMCGWVSCKNGSVIGSTTEEMGKKPETKANIKANHFHVMLCLQRHCWGAHVLVDFFILSVCHFVAQISDTSPHNRILLSTRRTKHIHTTLR